MKKVLLYSSIIVLSAIAAWQIARAISINNEERDELEYYRSLDLTALTHSGISEAYNGVPLGLGKIRMSDFKSDSCSLQDVFSVNKADEIYCARISATGCHPCIAETMRRVSEYKAENPEAVVIVIVANVLNRDLNVFGAQYGRKFDFYRADCFPLDFDEEITPSVFTIDAEGVVGNHEIISIR